MSSCLQSIYKKNDSDNSGTMSTPEMRVAFKDAGQFLPLLIVQKHENTENLFIYTRQDFIH